MKIEFVQQRCGSSCGIACVAMVSGVEFDTVLEWNERPGVSSRQLDQLLIRAGLKPIRYDYPDILPDKVYIVMVPSLNIKAGGHYIVIDTREPESSDEAAEGYTWCKLYDPVQGREGKESYTVDMLQTWGDIVEVRNAG